MADSYTQILIQFIFVVKYRDKRISKEFREPFEKYITGIITEKKHKLLAIYCMPDHCHILVGMKPHQSISDLARDIKANSSRWMNKEFNLAIPFRWQSGFAAFSYSTRQLDIIVRYILNQEAHHRKKSLHKEYVETLRELDVKYDNRYLFEDRE